MRLEPRLVTLEAANAIAHTRLKNDKVDVHTFAHLLHTDLLPEAWLAHPGAAAHPASAPGRIGASPNGLNVRVRSVLLDRVWELRDNLSAYDATYVALAERLGCSLLTADSRLSRAPRLQCPITVVPR